MFGEALADVSKQYLVGRFHMVGDQHMAKLICLVCQTMYELE
jgi:hypothetical protein